MSRVMVRVAADVAFLVMRSVALVLLFVFLPVILLATVVPIIVAMEAVMAVTTLFQMRLNKPSF